MVAVAEETADRLEEDNVSVEVIDLRLIESNITDDRSDVTSNVTLWT
jgi:pyruvate/2-oxoglutarate/acetoin dehydrogenase E1 component